MQILEARANGADTILLMVSILGVNQLKDLIQFSRSYRMEPLVEVTSIQELEIALEAGARVIGVNNRNLHDFSLDLSTTEKCLAHLKSLSPVFGTISIASLSGISTNQEVMKYQALGVNCCLVGEALMKAQDPLQKIKQLLGESESESEVPLIKICGVTNSDTANTAITSRVNLIGIIFVKSSPRFVSTDEAVKVVQRVRSYGERKERVAWKEILGSIPVNNPKTWFEGTKNLLHQITTRRPLVIGVFQNQPIEQVNSLLETVGFDIIQLHGDEDLDYIKNLNAPVLKTIHIGPNDTESTVVDNIHAAAKLYSGTALALLLDTATKEKSGGTGIKFDWNLLQKINVPVFVAGGLNVNNIPGLLKFRERLFGLDVNSGVESSPGRKEDFLIRQLMTSLYK